MSLVIAGVTNGTVWMLSDTAITGPKIELRERHYLPKIEPSNSGTALVAFAGDEHYGLRLLREATAEKDTNRAIQILVDGGRGIEVEFAYAHFHAGRPQLLRIADGSVEDVATLFLGSKDAFETFQHIRHNDTSPYAPLALKTFMCGARETVPEPLSDAIAAMIDVFASRAEHDVGGWAVPYFLTTDGPRFVSYCYSVSDLLFDRLAPSSLIPHGTQEEGGSSLSVTELGDDEGMVVYWLQLPGGTVLIRNADGYEAHFFPGRPSEFKTAADAALNRAIELWVGDQPLRPVRRLRMMRDANGALTCALADDGGGMSLAIYNLATPFHSRAELTMNNALSANTSPIGVEVTEEKNSVRLKCRAPQGAAVDVNLTASELDAFLLSTSTGTCGAIPASSFGVGSRNHNQHAAQSMLANLGECPPPASRHRA